jgi:hypothetical protein
MEYQHGAVSPIATIGIESQGCSVDPVTGKLAVVSGYGILILRYSKVGWHLQAVRTPPFKGCRAPTMTKEICSSTACKKQSYPAASRAAKGLENLRLVRCKSGSPRGGSVQWDGAHIAVTDSKAMPTSIYRYSISESSAVDRGQLCRLTVGAVGVASRAPAG